MKKNVLSLKRSIKSVCFNMSHRKHVFSRTKWKQKLRAETATAAKSIYFNITNTLSQYTHARTHACTHACMCTHTHIRTTHSCACALTHIHTPTHTCTQTHTCACTHIILYPHIPDRMRSHTQTNTCVRAHTHTFTHTHTHTHTLTRTFCTTVKHEHLSDC